MPITVAAKQLITATSIIDQPLITIEDSQITGLSTRDASDAGPVSYEFNDATLTAGLLDVHMHGAVGHDVMEGTREALRAVSVFLASRGVTEFLATTVTASMELTLRALDGIAARVEGAPAEDE